MYELSAIEAMQLFNTEQAGDILGVKAVVMETWRRKGIGPRYLRINSKCVRYRFSDLVEFQNANTVETSGRM
jgi:hypothetical protein